MSFKLTPKSTQHPRPTGRPLFGAAMVLLTLALAALAGCGGSDKESAMPAEGFDSAYCNTARAWAAHEVSADEILDGLAAYCQRINDSRH